MAFTPVYAIAGPTTGLSVANTSHAATQVPAGGAQFPQYAYFFNTGATGATPLIIYVTLGTNNGVAASTVPTDTATGSFPIAPGQGIVLQCPFQQPAPGNPPVAGSSQASFWLTAIGSAAGPTLLTVTPVIQV